jgi:hypothetical protein
MAEFSSDAIARAARVFQRKTLIRKGDCLLYPMRPDARGYGQINTGHGVVKAHRVAWEIEHGAIASPAIEIDHICHSRACCNVAHLRLANRGENLQNRAGATVASSTGLRGVVPKRDRFIAVVTVRGKAHRSPRSYATPEEAAAVASRMRRELMPFSAADQGVRSA